MDQVNVKVQEYLIGIRLVKAFGTYDKEKDGNHEKLMKEKGKYYDMAMSQVGNRSKA